MANSNESNADQREMHDRDGRKFEQAMKAARSGDREAIGRLLELNRDYLLLIANQDMEGDLKRKMGASDLVQESMLTAQANFNRFEGETRQEFLAWLRGILGNDVKHWRRHYKGVQKRNVRREKDLGGQQHAPPDPRDRTYTPGTQAVADEEAAMLENAIAKLPENYQRVIQMRNWQDKTFAEIGAELDCTDDAARKLWSRAIVRLQDVLLEQSPDLAPGFHSGENQSMRHHR